MIGRTSLLGCILAGAAILASAGSAAADDTLRVAIAHRGAWELAAAELGQQAGIFRKHGLTLDIVYPKSGDIEDRVRSGSIDVGVNIMSVMHDYSFGAPVRIIGANLTGAPAYWYVLATSPIRTIKDLVGKTIAYAAHGSASHYGAIDLIKQFGVRARLLSTGGAPAAFTELMENRIDVAYASPPFAVDEIDSGRIRVLARANDVTTIRGKTVSVMITSADTLQRRKDTITRFMQAYRETIDWMYGGPASIKAYATWAEVSEPVALRQRDEFFTKDMLTPDAIAGVKSVMKDAVTFRHLQKKLSRKQLAELIQIPPPKVDRQSGCRFPFIGCTAGINAPYP
jgi:NitT/TauT family transport system substrate-binding protein